MGRTLQQDSNEFKSLTYLEHFVPRYLPQHAELTPRKQPAVMIPYTGCSLNSYFPYDLRPNCVVIHSTKFLTTIKMFPLSSLEYRSL